MQRGKSIRLRYAALRWTLVQLRRLADRWHIDFDNAAESSRKAGTTYGTFVWTEPFDESSD